jgi:hypothetical protein
MRIDRLLDAVIGATPDALALQTDDGQVLSYAQLAGRVDAFVYTGTASPDPTDVGDLSALAATNPTLPVAPLSAGA